MTTVILSGGSGTRLWPISRTLMPKQFVKLNQNKSLFQQTVIRNSKISDKFMIISNIEHKFLVLDHLQDITDNESTFIWESVAKNSAAAIIMAALNANKDDILCVVPSDHVINDQEAYEKTIKQAKELAEKDNIVAVGIKPSFPATGYGYIKHKNNNVESFIEKPSEDIAKSFLKDGNYLWNGGIYCFKASHFLNICEEIIPELLNGIKHSYKNSLHIGAERTVLANDVKNIESISIDNALMESLDKNFKVVPLSSKWNDMGSFDSFDEVCDDNFIDINNDKIISIESSNNCIISSDRTIAALNVNNLIIVDTPDALLITTKGNSQNVKKVVNELNTRNSDLTKLPATVARPWGTYTVLENTTAYKTKKLVVKPGKRLSLQSHFHRNEHWIVVSGTAKVTIAQEVKLLQANESTYIPAGELHRLENPGLIPLIMIEAQIGEYLEEDDIVRYEDDFNRIA